jgi:hypothetical protein
MHPHFKASQKVASLLMNVGAEAVEWSPECLNMKHIADQEALPIKINDGCSLPKARSVRVVAHVNAKVPYGLVRNESRVVREHMVGCTRVCHDEAMPVSKRDGAEERGNQVLREDDDITQSCRVGQRATHNQPNVGSKWRNGLRQDPRAQREVIGNQPVRFIVALSSSPYHQKLSAELSSLPLSGSTVAVKPAGVEVEPELRMGGDTTAAGAAAGGEAEASLTLLEPKEDPNVASPP